MPLFDKQEGHCLRISTQVVKWPERGDVRRVTDTVAWMEYVLWRPGLTKTGSAISQESGLVRFVMDRAYRNCPKIVIGCKVVCLPGFPQKVCRSGSDLDSPNHMIRI